MYHTTREGVKTLIAQMDDAHLKNTIDLAIASIEKCVGVMNNDVKISSNLDFIGSGVTTANLKREAEARLKLQMQKLPYYIFEATIRGISYTEKLQKIYGRSAKLADEFSNMLAIGHDDDEDLDYDD